MALTQWTEKCFCLVSIGAYKDLNIRNRGRLNLATKSQQVLWTDVLELREEIKARECLGWHCIFGM